MFLTRPIHPDHCHADLIWWDGPFKYVTTLRNFLERICSPSPWIPRSIDKVYKVCFLRNTISWDFPVFQQPRGFSVDKFSCTKRAAPCLLQTKSFLDVICSLSTYCGVLERDFSQRLNSSFKIIYFLNGYFFISFTIVPRVSIGWLECIPNLTGVSYLSQLTKKQRNIPCTYCTVYANVVNSL